MSGADREIDDLYHQAVGQAGDGAPNFAANFEKAIKPAFKRIHDSVPKGSAQDRLYTGLESKFNSIVGRAKKFERDERINFQVKTIDNEVDDLTQKAIRNTGVPKYNVGSDPRLLPLDGDINTQAARFSSLHETGTTDLAKGSLQIATDTSGSRSYGILGVNSLERSGSAKAFARENPNLGLTAKPGTAEFDQQWRKAAQDNPQGLVDAQLRYHKQHILNPAKNQLKTAGLDDLANDPRVLAFVADGNVQYGPNLIKKHLKAGAGSKSANEFIERAAASMRANIDGDFVTYLGENPQNRRGIQNRITRRVNNSLSLGGPDLDAIPKWEGRIPSIDDVPGIADVAARLEGLVQSSELEPSRRREIIEGAKSKLVGNWLQQLTKENPSAAKAAIESGRFDQYITVKDEVGLKNSAENAQQRFIAQAEKQQKKILKGYRDEARNLLKDEIASLENTGQSLGALDQNHQSVLTPTERDKLTGALDRFNVREQVKAAPTQELPSLLESLKPEGDGFAQEQELFEFAEKEIASREKAQGQDPAGFALSGDPDYRREFDQAFGSNNPLAIQNAVRNNLERQAALNVPQVRPLPQSVLPQFQASLQAEDPAKAFEGFQQITARFGDLTPQVLAQIEEAGGPKGWPQVHQLFQTNPALAQSLARVVHSKAFEQDSEIAMRLALDGQEQVAEQIFEGRTKRETVKGITPKGKSADTDQSVDQIINKTLGDALNAAPSALAGVKEATLSHYANGSSLGDEFSGERLKGSINAVLGGVLEHNGDDGAGRFIPPVHGMTQNQFNRALDQVTNEDLKGAFVGFSEVAEPVTADMLQDELQLVSVGNGVYRLRYPDAPGGGLVRNENNQPFELNFSELLPSLVGRVNEQREKTKVSASGGISVTQGGFNPNVFAPGGILDNYDAETGQRIN